MECSECENVSYSLYGTDTTWLQRYFYCQYAEAIASSACQLCFGNFENNNRINEGRV